MQIVLAVEVPLYLAAGWGFMPWNSLGFYWDLTKFCFHGDLKHWSYAAIVRFHSEKWVWRESQVHSCRVGKLLLYVLIRPQRIKSVISVSAFRDTRHKGFHREMWFHSDSISLKAKQTLHLLGASALLSGAHCGRASFFQPCCFLLHTNIISKGKKIYIRAYLAKLKSQQSKASRATLVPKELYICTWFCQIYLKNRWYIMKKKATIFL